jgi:putative selenate reductase YgfK subunit
MGKNSDILMPVEIAGIKFRNPFYISSGPASKSVEQFIKAEKNGWAGVSLKLTFDPAPYINLEPRYGWFRDSGFLAFTAETRLKIDEGLKIVEEARKKTGDIVIFANMSYVGDKGLDGWVNMARRFQSAGAHVIELNMCCPNMSFNVEKSGAGEGKMLSGVSIGMDACATSAVVRAVKKAVSIPVFVKLSPEGGKIAEVARASFEAGADSVGSSGNRLGVLPVDIYNPGKGPIHLQKQPTLACFSGTWSKPLTLRETYEMRKAVGPGAAIATTGGVFDSRDALEMFMAGADMIGICTAVLVKGYGFLPGMIMEIKDYLKDRNYDSLKQVTGALVKEITAADNLTVYGGYANKKEENLLAPCTYACPTGMNPQEYVRKTAEGDFRTAYEMITSNTPLSSVLGFVCTHPCEGECTRNEVDRALNIRAIKKFIIKYGKKRKWSPKIGPCGPRRNLKVAVIGSGPAGLACSFDLARAGYDMTIFESEEKPGGMLERAIPEFRLPKSIVREDISVIRKLGVDIKTNTRFGSDITYEGLKKAGYKAVFLGIGAQKGRPLNIPGEESKGCFTALEFLKDISKKRKVSIGRKVAVIGGGFTALDAALTCRELGAGDVFILYRRTKEEMPALPSEVEEAERRGIKIMYLVSPKKIISAKGRVRGVKMVNHVLGEKDATARRKPVEVEGTEFTLEADTVIAATGQDTEPVDTVKIARTAQGYIKCAEDTSTSVEGVFAGGDAVTGPENVAKAIHMGRKSAAAIDRYLSGRKAFLKEAGPAKCVDKEIVLKRQGCFYTSRKEPLKRDILTEADALKEANRCLNCGCSGYACALCEKVCPSIAITIENGKTRIDREKCHACGMCYQVCPTSNIEMTRKDS